ncbi:hypothetical protein E2C01_069615 [Portunus trituberculatus]|uniref:Uncharacterized protein n=1 Tax=Portunus trituberculatus TaxID=210409 RepID=A0A5B7HQI1_PORTR|nr:hypothetical protein [Portunus trituberculatus]
MRRSGGVDSALIAVRKHPYRKSPRQHRPGDTRQRPKPLTGAAEESRSLPQRYPAVAASA